MLTGRVVPLLCAAAMAVMLAMPGAALAEPVVFSSNLTQSSISATTHEASPDLLFEEDGITVDNNIALQATGSSGVSFTSADWIQTDPGSTVAATAGNVTMVAGQGDDDNDAGITLYGLVSASGSGNVTLTADNGNICIGSIVASGTVTITALGGSVEPCSGSSGAITAGGAVNIEASGNIALGGTGDGSVKSGAGMILSAGGNLSVNDEAIVSNGSSGNMSVTAGGDITMTTGSGGIANAPEFINNASSGTVDLQAGAGGVFDGASTGIDAVRSNNGGIVIGADSVSIGAAIDSGTATTTVEPSSPGRPIDLGGTPTGSLGLTNAELGKVTASVLRIGSPIAGDITLSSPISGLIPNVLALVANGSVIDGVSTTAPLITVPDLRLSVSGAIGATNTIETNVQALALDNGAGSVAIANSQPLTIGQVDTVTGVISNGSVSLTSTGPLNISQPVQTQGTVTLGSIHAGGPAANVTVSPSASVSSSSGDAVIQAANNVSIENGATVSASGAVRLTCDNGDTNPVDTCSVNVPGGGLTGSPVALSGGSAGPATFAVAGESLSGHGPLTITGAPGSASTATVTATTVSSSPGAGLILDQLSGGSVTGGTFTDNAGDGIAIDHSTGVTISGNSIASNGNLGIDLLDGSNHSQAAPVLTSAAPSGSSTVITGKLTSTPSHTYTLEYFDNQSCDVNGVGEGKTSLGTSTITTDASGHATINVTLPAPSGANDIITATATDQASNETSAFSRCIGADLALTLSASPSTVAAGGTLTYTMKVTNNGPIDSTGSTVVDTLPAGVTFVSASPGCGLASGKVTCNLGALASGASTTLSILATAPNHAASLTDTAVVTGNEKDFVASNNNASVTITVIAPTPTGPPTRPPKPVLSNLAIKPATLHPAKHGASTAAVKAKKKAPSTGATVSYNDTLAAQTVFTVEEVLPGRTSGKSCAKPSKRNKHGRKCTRFVPLHGSFAHKDSAGKNSFHLTGRLNGKALKPGVYRLDATPTADGETGSTVSVRFRVK